MDHELALQPDPRLSSTHTLDSASASVPRACQLSVIIPTYREVENLPRLIPLLADALAETGLPGEILIIDDDSQDGTDVLCKDLAATYPVRLVLRRAERGLASAVLRGLREARGDILVVMDADLSHPPQKIPELIHPLLTREADFVIGSRYVAGGQTDARWSLFRRLNSRVATWLAWPLTATRDPLAGFFALPRSVYERAAARLNPIGYKIGLELIVKGGCRHIKEVPIHFRDRTSGTSKLGWQEQVNYLRHLLRLYLYRLWSR
jgi:dolichol-phosphate mannosyltransferase